jgi:hypothetical protein
MYVYLLAVVNSQLGALIFFYNKGKGKKLASNFGWFLERSPGKRSCWDLFWENCTNAGDFERIPGNINSVNSINRINTINQFFEILKN